MPTNGPPSGLSDLNLLIARMETSGNVGFFKKLLAPEFAMRRANTEVYVGREDFLEAVESSFERHTNDIHVILETDTIAVVRCTVTRLPDRSAFDNTRIFVRPARTLEWMLLAWANELR